jgi:hypothetical protein
MNLETKVKKINEDLNKHKITMNQARERLGLSKIPQEYNKNKNKIALREIIKLQHLYIDIFTEEDEDYPDGRIINNKEKAVQRILDRITDKRFNQIEIWKVIQFKSWDTTDNTYRPICNRLRELGYEIIN